MKHLEIAVPTEDSQINGNLTLVTGSKSLVVFAHGSGSSRFSTRNKYVAEVLNQAGISTLLFDLLTKQEDEIDQFTRKFRFDIILLAERLSLVTQWLKKDKQTSDLKLGYFGASTGAAATLIAAAVSPEDIHAIVSRGGRPDMAGDYLHKVKSPTLLIVGELDYEVIKLNEIAYSKLQCTKEIEIVSNATHLFEEPGTLEQASNLALDWFKKYLK